MRLTAAVRIIHQLNAGKRLRYRDLCAEYGVNIRTAYRWMEAIGAAVPLVRTTDGDGCAVFSISLSPPKPDRPGVRHIGL